MTRTVKLTNTRGKDVNSADSRCVLSLFKYLTNAIIKTHSGMVSYYLPIVLTFLFV